MLRNNKKFLVITVFLGVMFFCVSSGAMENNNFEKKLENLDGNKKENNSENEDIEESVIKIRDKENDVENKKTKENINESKILESGTKEHINNNSIGIEYKKFIDYWTRRWEKVLNSLAEQNKLTNLEEAKEHIEKLIKKDIENFEDVLERFEKYNCEFKEYENDEYDLFYDMEYEDVFFNFDELKKILEEENETLLREKDIKIDEELVIKYVNNVLKNNESLQNKIKTYKDLIRDAYIDYLNKNSYDDDYIFDPSEINDEGRFIFNKENSIENLDEGKKYILRMKEILEKIKEESDKDILYASCSELSIVVEDGVVLVCEKNRNQNVKSILKNFNELEDIFKIILRDEKTHFLKHIFKNTFKYETRDIDDIKQYFEKFIRVLKQAASEGISKGFIDGILKSLEGKGSTREIIKKFREYIDKKIEIINDMSFMNIQVDDVLIHLEEYKQKLFKLLYGGCSENIFKKLEQNLLKGIENIEMNSRNKDVNSIDFEDLIYVEIIKDLAHKYKLAFFDKLEELIKNDFENIKKVRRIKLNLNDIEKNNLLENKLEELICELKGNVDDENIEEIRYIAGEERFFKFFIEKVKNLIKEDSINFYVNLKNQIKKEYESILSIKEITENLNNLLDVLDNKTSEEEIKSRLDKFIEKMKDFAESEKVIPKMKSLFEKLTFKELRQFFNDDKNDVKDKKDISDVYEKIILLMSDRYKELQKEEINKDLENVSMVLDNKTSEEEIKSRLDKFIEKMKDFAESEKVIPKMKSLFKKLTFKELRQFINDVKEDVEKQKDISDVYEKIALLTSERYEVLQVEEINKDLINILVVLDNKTSEKEIKSSLDKFIEKMKDFSESEKVIPKMKSLFKKLTLQELRQFFNDAKNDVKDKKDISDVYDKIISLMSHRYKELQKEETIKNLKNVVLYGGTSEEIKSRLDKFIEKMKDFAESKKFIVKMEYLFRRVTLYEFREYNDNFKGPEKFIDEIKFLFENLSTEEFLKFINDVYERIENRGQIDMYKEIMILTNLEYETIKERIEINKLKEEINSMLQKIEEEEKKNDKYKETQEFKILFEELRKKSELVYKKEKFCGPHFKRLEIDLVKDVTTGHYNIKKTVINNAIAINDAFAINDAIAINNALAINNAFYDRNNNNNEVETDIE